jgi:heterodisulfide reductase subunit C2
MSLTQSLQKIIHNSKFRDQVEQASGEKFSACFQCQKCTNGCPMTFAMDIPLHQLIHLIQLNKKNEVINSNAIWVCASCETCTARCPNNINIAHIIDILRQMSSGEGVKDSQKKVPLFHSVFLDNIKKFGRMHEITMMVNYALRNEGPAGLFKQAGTGMTMFFKGKIKIFPDGSTGKKVKPLFKKK